MANEQALWEGLDKYSRKAGDFDYTSLGSAAVLTMRMKPLPCEIISYEHVVDTACCLPRVTRKVEIRMGCGKPLPMLGKRGS